MYLICPGGGIGSPTFAEAAVGKARRKVLRCSKMIYVLFLMYLICPGGGIGSPTFAEAAVGKARRKVLRCSKMIYVLFLMYLICPGGGIGRHAGLKILWPVMAVRVQVPPRVLLSNEAFSRAFFVVEILLTKKGLTLSQYSDRVSQS